MDTKFFFDYLPLLRKSLYFYEEKRNEGWSNDEISSYRFTDNRSTTPMARKFSFRAEGLPKELESIYKDYDLGNLSFIGGMSFWSSPKKLEQGWGFADMSEVNIVIAPSGQIEAYNAHPIRGMPGATDCLGVLAQNLESYLAALFYAQFNKSHFISGFPDENPILYEKTVLVAKHCALIAGGYAFYDFWAGILGLPYSDTVPE